VRGRETLDVGLSADRERMTTITTTRTGEEERTVRTFTWSSEGLSIASIGGRKPCTYEPPLLLVPRRLVRGATWDDQALCDRAIISLSGTVDWDGTTWNVVHRFTIVGSESVERLDFDDLARPPLRVIDGGTEEDGGTTVRRRRG
jgi:hypothetical protein